MGDTSSHDCARRRGVATVTQSQRRGDGGYISPGDTVWLALGLLACATGTVVIVAMKVVISAMNLMETWSRI